MVFARAGPCETGLDGARQGETGLGKVQDHRCLVGTQVCDTFKEACVMRGLLADDKEWDECLQEAILTEKPASLRSLFAIILDFNTPKDPGRLWKKYLNHFAEDHVYRARQTNLDLSIEQLHNAALWDLEILLQSQGRTLSEFPGMPTARKPVASHTISEAMRHERDYDRAIEKAKVERDLAMCNDEQRAVFTKLTIAYLRSLDQPELFFIYASGGCGKTFYTIL